MAEQATFGEWAIVELFGHRRLAGYLTEQEIAGHGFLRLQVPAVEDMPERTQFYSPSAVYAFHPVTEETARAVAAECHYEPVSRWDVRGLIGVGGSPDPFTGDYDEEA